jgi:hypothetical protein
MRNYYKVDISDGFKKPYNESQSSRIQAKFKAKHNEHKELIRFKESYDNRSLKNKSQQCIT